MAGFRDIAKKYKAKIESIADDRQKLALILANDAKALITNRLQETGIDAEGNRFKPYSEKRSPYWLLNPANFRNGTKINKFKKDAAKGKNNASYRALRDAYGLTTSIRNFTFDGDMMNSVFAEIESHDKFVTVAVIKSKDRLNQDKINWNSGIVGINIIKMDSSERALVHEGNKERIKKLLE